MRMKYQRSGNSVTDKRKGDLLSKTLRAMKEI